MKKSMVRRVGRVFLLSLCVGTLTAATAYAAGDDPLAIVNNLSDFIFSIIKAVGIIILGWGVVQVGMSMQSRGACRQNILPVCSAAFWLKRKRSVHNDSGGGRTWITKMSSGSARPPMWWSGYSRVQKQSRKW